MVQSNIFDRNNLYLKILIISIIIIFLLIPKFLVEEVIDEREERQESAVNEISSIWSNPQTIIGPVLSFPFTETITDSSKRIINIKRSANILPEQLKISSSIFPERRYRGIYEVIVYNSKINIEGFFNTNQLSKLRIPKEKILFNEAYFSLGIDDLRGIENQVEVNINEKTYKFLPGLKNENFYKSGINTDIEIDSNSTDGIFKFKLSLDLKGSGGMYFAPIGKTTEVLVNSNWKTPSFVGSFLPDNRKIDDNGFESYWNILHLNRNFPQEWVDDINLNDWIFGFKLLVPVDTYQKSTRTVKYAILIIILTFTVFFVIELTNKKQLHPFQYLMIGLALIIFYTLLVSSSEYIDFNLAYAITTVAVTSLISFYIQAVLKSKNISILIGATLLITYGFVFTIIQLEDFALLLGSIALFIALAILMISTRKIDWYNLNN